VHWDDLDLLRTIDALEDSEPVSLTNGFFLMQRAANGVQLDHSQDQRAFVWELLVAAHDDLVTWDPRGVSQQYSDPFTDTNAWLQQIRDVRLTIRGRDRARGRVVLLLPPDPDEDDGRQIMGLTLEEIALDLGESLLPSQLRRYLRDSGIPDESLGASDGTDKGQYLLAVFENLHNGGSAARRALRIFLGSWLENRQPVGPRPDAQRRIVAQLARQGWFVKEGRLVVGDPQFGDVPLAPPLGREARLAALHPLVRRAALRYVDDGHMGAAILESFKAVNNRVKEMTGLDADGAELMGKAFGGTTPRLVLTDLSTRSGQDEQAGFLDIFRGAVRGIRNPNAHEPFGALDDNAAIEQLTLASLLMHRLDATTSADSSPSAGQ